MSPEGNFRFIRMQWRSSDEESDVTSQRVRVSAGELVVGIDLGGSKVNAAIADADGTFIARHREGTEEDLASQVVTVTERLAAQAGVTLDRVAATVIGGAGVPLAGGLEDAPNLVADDSRTFAFELADRLGHPIRIENDVNVAAVGELHYGVGRDVDTFVVMSVGTGVGMGVVVRRQLVRGSHNAAGEIAHLPVGSDPFDPASQVHGPFEEMVAGSALVERYFERSGKVATSEQIFDSLASDEDARASVREHGRWMALGIAAVRAVLDPHLFVFNGGLGLRSELMTDTRFWLGRLGIDDFVLTRSSLGEDAGLRGATHIAREVARTRTAR